MQNGGRSRMLIFFWKYSNVHGKTSFIYKLNLFKYYQPFMGYTLVFFKYDDPDILGFEKKYFNIWKRLSFSE